MLKEFILPSGSRGVQPLPACTVCRRAERRVYSRQIDNSLESGAMRHLGIALSGSDFVAARVIARAITANEVLWKPRTLQTRRITPCCS